MRRRSGRTPTSQGDEVIRITRWFLAAMVLGAVLAPHSAHADEAKSKPSLPELSGRWVLDEKASTMPRRPAEGTRQGGGPPGGGRRGGAGRGGMGGGGMRGGERPEGGAPAAGARGIPREFTLEQFPGQLLLSERGLPFRVLVLTRERVVDSLAPEGTPRSEGHWEGDALVVDDLTRGGAARKQTWRLDPKDPARLIVSTRIEAEGERPALELKQVYLRGEATE